MRAVVSVAVAVVVVAVLSLARALDSSLPKARQTDMGPKQKKPRSLTKQDSAEPGLMIAASRRVVLAADIVDGTMLHALALENLQQFKSMHPDSPLCCGQAASQPEALELSWASACSGSEGAFYVTEAMNAAYKRMSVPVSLEHVFSCERLLDRFD